MSMACAVFCGQSGRSAARKSEAYNFAPVTLATPSMRPTPVAAGFQAPLPGSVSRVANPGSSAKAKRDRLSAMPLAVAPFTNSRREVHIVPPLASHDDNGKASYVLRVGSLATERFSARKHVRWWRAGLALRKQG